MTENMTEAHQVLAQLWEIADTVQDPPDLTNGRGCVYALPTVDPAVAKPVCIVGQWLARQGLNLAPLAESRALNSLRFSALTGWEIRDRGEQDTPAAELVEKIDALPLTDAARTVLQAVQESQDNGTPWRDAVASIWCQHLGLMPRMAGLFGVKETT